MPIETTYAAIASMDVPAEEEEDVAVDTVDLEAEARRGMVDLAARVKGGAGGRAQRRWHRRASRRAEGDAAGPHRR